MVLWLSKHRYQVFNICSTCFVFVLVMLPLFKWNVCYNNIYIYIHIWMRHRQHLFMIPSIYAQLPWLFFLGDLSWVPKNLPRGKCSEILSLTEKPLCQKINQFEVRKYARWWFQIFFYFHPDTWGNDPIWRAYFSNGLKPPPRKKQKEHRIVMGISEPTNCPLNFLRSVCPLKSFGFYLTFATLQ